MEDYSLARPDVISKLKDREWFVGCVRATYYSIAKAESFEVELTKFRVYEAHDLWTEDLEKLLDHGIEDSNDLDIYKHAGFLSYWLRRRLVINSIDIDNSELDGPQPHISRCADDLPDKMKKFLQFHNERSAFDFGVRLCFNYKINELKDDRYTEPKIDEYVDEISKRTSQIAWDVSVLMKQKSISPHTLYLVYKTLFLH